MPPKSEQTEKQPGADRFWGQFSQSKAGRSTSGDEPHGETGRDEPRGAGDGSAEDGHCLEWCPICRSADLFRSTVSPELKQQAESIQHEAFGVLKAFLDAYADKTGEHGPAASGSRSAPDQNEPEEPAAARVKEIPLD
jgi:hypothetical protein